MASKYDECKGAASPVVIAAMALIAACGPASKPIALERTTWDGTPTLPVQAKKDAATTYVQFTPGFFLQPAAQEFALPLPGGSSIVLSKTGEESRADNRLVWKGQIKGDSASVVTIGVSDVHIAGNVIAATGKMYRLEQVAPGVLIVFEVNRNLFPAEAQPLQARETIEGVPGTVQAESSCPADNAQNIEVLVVYTEAACAGADLSGPPNSCTAEVQGKLRADIDTVKGETNSAFTRSEVPSQASSAPQISVVDVIPAGAYAESNDLTKERTRLLLSGDDEMENEATQVTYLDDVQQWRNQYRADIVALVTKPAGIIVDGPSCGASALMGNNQAWFEKYAYLVVPVDCMNLNQSFTHELGHLLGAGHRTATPSSASNFSANNRAHVQLDPANGSVDPWRTVMAENDSDCTSTRDGGCTRVLNFSNPDVEYLGDSTGSPSENNNEVVNSTATTVSKFRRALSCGNP